MIIRAYLTDLHGHECNVGQIDTNEGNTRGQGRDARYLSAAEKVRAYRLSSQLRQQSSL